MRNYVSAEQLMVVHEKHYHLSRFGDVVEKFAGQEPTRRTVHQQLEFGRAVMKDPRLLIDSSRFLQREMLIRLARTIRSFQNLPYIVGVNPSIQAVYVKCWDWFVRLHEFTESHGEVTNAEEEDVFTRHLTRVFEDHGNVMHCLRRGISEVRALPSSDSVDFDYVDKFLTRFIMRRISWRILAETHLALKNPRGAQYNGVYNTMSSPADIATECFCQAQYLCESELGRTPDFAIKGDVETKFEYIDSHLHYVLLEVFKNSMRATVLHHEDELPKVVMRVCEGDEITLCIVDRGGGIPKSIADNVWAYGFTTAADTGRRCEVNAYFPGMQNASMEMESCEEKPLAGWGFGLPLSRCFIEYLGGRMEIRNMPGYGCDTILTLPKLHDERFREHLDFA